MFMGNQEIIEAHSGRLFHAKRQSRKEDWNMGLFDKVFGGNQPPKMTPPEAFVGVVMSAVAADGVITQEEALSVITILNRMKLYKGMNEKELKSMLDRTVNTLKSQGPSPLIAAAKETLPADLRDTAFAVAADLVLADGVVENTEKKFLEDLQKAMGVPDEVALKITEVMVIKNRG
jgi:tellurite resistance protein